MFPTPVQNLNDVLVIISEVCYCNKISILRTLEEEYCETKRVVGCIKTGAIIFTFRLVTSIVSTKAKVYLVSSGGSAVVSRGIGVIILVLMKVIKLLY